MEDHLMQCGVCGIDHGIEECPGLALMMSNEDAIAVSVSGAQGEAGEVPPYRAERDDHRMCLSSGEFGIRWLVVRSDGSDVDNSFGDQRETQSIAKAMNLAYAEGVASMRAKLTRFE